MTSRLGWRCERDLVPGGGECDRDRGGDHGRRGTLSGRGTRRGHRTSIVAASVVVRPERRGRRLDLRQRSFGRWIVDRFGLPAYRYDVDEQVARRARQPELNGGTAAQHELGNDHITAAAFNDGYTQLWSQDRARAVDQPLRARRAPLRRRLRLSQRSVAGCSARCTSTGTRLHARAAVRDRLLRAAAALPRRSRCVRTFTHRSGTTRCCCTTSRSATPAATRSASRGSSTGMSTRSTRPRAADRPRPAALGRSDQHAEPLLRRPPTASRAAEHLCRRAARPASPVTRHRSRRSSAPGPAPPPRPSEPTASVVRRPPAAASGRRGATLFAFRAPVRLRAGQSVTLRYAYGLAHAGEDRARSFSRYARAPHRSRTSEAAWARWLPKASFGPERRGWHASWNGTPTCCAQRRSTTRPAGITRSPRAATTSTAAD